MKKKRVFLYKNRQKWRTVLYSGLHIFILQMHGLSCCTFPTFKGERKSAPPWSVKPHGPPPSNVTVNSSPAGMRDIILV